MLISFSVENFGSIKDKQTLSFEATKSTHLDDNYVIETKNGLRLLKLGLIYGANASGKTTVLKALDFLRELVLNPVEKKTDTLKFSPFLFDPETPNELTRLSIDFIQNDTRYFYEVEFNRQCILHEKLDYYSPKKANVFTRLTDVENEYSTIKFGSKLSVGASSRKILEGNTIWNNTVLAGFLETNLNIQQLKSSTDWFAKHLKPIVLSNTKLDSYITGRIDDGKINKQHVLSILQKADFHISDIDINKKDENISEDLMKVLENKFSNNRIEAIKEKGTITVVKLAFQHMVNGNSHFLPFEMESQGTQRYYGFAGLLAMLIQDSVTIPIDELESSLHPDLYNYFILSFLANARSSQLIATTHNREILNNKDVFRDDAIWFTSKNESCATELYSLADFDSSTVRDTTNVLNAYKAGKLGGVPNLGDYYIDLSDGE